MPLSQKENEELVLGVSEDLLKYTQTKEGEVPESDLLAWRSGYIAGYERAKALLSQSTDESGNTESQE